MRARTARPSPSHVQRSRKATLVESTREYFNTDRAPAAAIRLWLSLTGAGTSSTTGWCSRDSCRRASSSSASRTRRSGKAATIRAGTATPVPFCAVGTDLRLAHRVSSPLLAPTVNAVATVVTARMCCHWRECTCSQQGRVERSAAGVHFLGNGWMQLGQPGARDVLQPLLRNSHPVPAAPFTHRFVLIAAALHACTPQPAWSRHWLLSLRSQPAVRELAGPVTALACVLACDFEGLESAAGGFVLDWRGHHVRGLLHAAQ